MKRTIIIHILLLVALAALLMAMIKSFINVSSAYEIIDTLRIGEQNDPTADYSYEIALERSILISNIIYGIAYFLSVLADIAAMTLIAIKEFPVFKPLIDKMQPLVDKIQAKRNARKEAHAAAKTARAEAKKQKRIEELQAELDELKKDE